LVIHGRDDRVNPTANAPLLAERIPGAECTSWKAAVTVTHRDAEEASRVVREFLGRHGLGSPDAGRTGEG
jgi:pimeloyl-ACP methyl ester carboxylesterase